MKLSEKGYKLIVKLYQLPIYFSNAANDADAFSVCGFRQYCVGVQRFNSVANRVYWKHLLYYPNGCRTLRDPVNVCSLQYDDG